MFASTAGTTFAVIGVLFLLSAIRTFTSSLYMSLYGTVPNETVGAIALGVFAMSIFGALLAWRTSPRRAIALSATVLVLATALGAVSRWNWGDVAFGAIAVVAGTWWLALTQSARTGDGASPLATGLPIAIAADLALRATFRTVDVVDLPGAVAPALVIAAGLAMLAGGAATYGPSVAWTSPGPRGAVALFGVPLLLLVGETAATDPGQAAGMGSFARGPESPGAWYAVALLLGIGMTVSASVLTRGRPGARVIAVAALIVGAAIAWAHVPYLATLGAAIMSAGVIAAATTLPDTASRVARNALLTAVAFTLGWVAFIAVAFVFFAYYTPPLAALAAVALVAIGVVAARPRPDPRFAFPGAALIAVLAIVVPFIALIATPGAPIDAAPRSTFRLMTYNIHQGFDDGNVPSLDAIADTIKAESPDVVVLQEVARGWMITDQQDTLTYLAERLGMQYVFGPAIGDAYGNAVLSRLPVSDVEYIAYERQAKLRHQPRGAIFFRVADVLVVATHLDHIAEASDVRQGQVHSILAKWNSRSPAVVAGDLNALPGSAELVLLQQAGFRDLAKEDGADQPTSPSASPQHRVDYVWGIGVSGSQAHTVTSTASDHRPLVITISRR